jgi:hypothetical protein
MASGCVVFRGCALGFERFRRTLGSVLFVLPETDMHRARRWAEGKVPADLRNEIRMEIDTSPTALTIFECRPPWKFRESGAWTRSPIARLRYTQSKRSWTLYWCDQHEKFHRYEFVPPTQSLDRLLTEIDDDPTAIFWG